MPPVSLLFFQETATLTCVCTKKKISREKLLVKDVVGLSTTFIIITMGGRDTINTHFQNLPRTVHTPEPRTNY